VSARVSVIVPCWNDGAFLDEALASVAAQTMRDHETIVVDDGSTDAATRAALDQIDARVLRVRHGGVSAARNAGIAAATGELLCFLDADDRLRPTCFEKCCARFAADPELSFVSFWVHLFGAEEWDWRPTSCDPATLLDECVIATPALVTRDAVVEAGGFDAACALGHEDWDLWLSLVARGRRGAIVPELLFDYRRRPHSRSRLADDSGMYLELLRAQFRKHEALYRAHLADALARKDAAMRGHLDVWGAP
jgi:glycosyltransferase involved in cell wall biosynthesis